MREWEMAHERTGNGKRENRKRKARERKLPEGKARDGRRALRNKKSARLAGLKHTENNQQSIARTTHFFSTTEMFGRNTPFSARFRNPLTLKHLHPSHTQFYIVDLSFFTIKHAFSQCETCPPVVRKTPNGGSVRHVSQLERCLTASASHISRGSRRQKWLFRTLFHSNSRHNFFTKIPNNTHPVSTLPHEGKIKVAPPKKHHHDE